jgi:hypothetical protein
MPVARFIDPTTGDVSLDGRTWRRAPTPELAIVVLSLIHISEPTRPCH